MDRALTAARHLLAESRLHADIDDYWMSNGDIDWNRMRADRAYSTSEAALIDLCEGVVDGALGRAGLSFDDHNWAVLLAALVILRDRPTPRLAA